VAPALAAEVSTAYLQYWQVVADTALTLDPGPLEEVAAEEQLEALRSNIEEDRSNNRATHMKLQHDFIVVFADATHAQVADRLRDLSYYVDASTLEPLPGQTEPVPEIAPRVNAILDLRQVDGHWKVVRAAKAVPEGRTP